MIKNFIKTTFRNLYNNKAFTLIKITGLALALAVSLSIFMWARYQLSYDKHFSNADNIYRVMIQGDLATLPPGFKTLLQKIPNVEHHARLLNSAFLGAKTKIASDEKIFTNNRLYYADSTFFTVFAIPFVQGDPDNALSNPDAVVITRSTAAKYFGDKDPVGQALTIADSKTVFITGVTKDMPENSHFHYDILVNMQSHPWAGRVTGFGSSWIFSTYVAVAPGADVNTIKANINHELLQYADSFDSKITLQPLADIHLHSSAIRELETNGDITYVYLFSGIGLLIILVASINYVNLTTALAAQRAREIGIRKAIGADKKELILQILGESVIVSGIAFLLAILLLNMMRPVFFSFFGITFFRESLNNPLLYLMAFSFTLAIGALTGLFPALTLSGNSIIDAIKPGFLTANDKKRARGLLVCSQLGISVVLMTCTLVIFQQMQYVQHKKLGYNKDHVLVLHAGYSEIVQKSNILKSMIAANPDIRGITTASQLPTNIVTMEGFNTKDGTRYETSYISVDKDFFSVMGIPVIKGSEKIKELIPPQSRNMQAFENKFVVNQVLLDKIGIDINETQDNPIMIRHGNMVPGPIIGVVQDFHFKSLHLPIKPLIFEFTPETKEYMLIKMNTDNIPATIGFIRNQWDQVAAGLPFEYHFLDESYNDLYKVETLTSRLFLTFTLVSLFIIIIGLSGLISYMTIRKTKEIGIRKVLGASVQNVLVLLSGTIVNWTIIANIIAWPAAYFLINKWLSNFAYRIHASWWLFLTAGTLVLAIALLSVSWQVIRAARANPVKALRYE